MTPRVVLDSNVIISGFLFGGPPARILELAVSGSIRCYTSLPILDEVRDVLQHPKFGLPPGQALELVEELHGLCEVVSPSRRIRVIDADPADDMFLECAEAAKADMIVSGDSPLLDLGMWNHIRIFSPSAAVLEIERSTEPGPHRR